MDEDEMLTVLLMDIMESGAFSIRCKGIETPKLVYLNAAINNLMDFLGG